MDKVAARFHFRREKKKKKKGRANRSLRLLLLFHFSSSPLAVSSPLSAGEVSAGSIEAQFPLAYVPPPLPLQAKLPRSCDRANIGRSAEFPARKFKSASRSGFPKKTSFQRHVLAGIKQFLRFVGIYPIARACQDLPFDLNDPSFADLSRARTRFALNSRRNPSVPAAVPF